MPRRNARNQAENPYARVFSNINRRNRRGGRYQLRGVILPEIDDDDEATQTYPGTTTRTYPGSTTSIFDDITTQVYHSPRSSSSEDEEYVYEGRFRYNPEVNPIRFAALTKMPLINSSWGINMNEEKPVEDHDAVFTEYDQFFQIMIGNIRRIARYVLDCPHHYRTEDERMSGVPLGLLVYVMRKILREELTFDEEAIELIMETYTVTGQMIVFENVVNERIGSDNEIRKEVSTNVLYRDIVDWPLDKVKPFVTRESDLDVRDLVAYLLKTRYKTGGSDLSTFIMSTDLYISKRIDPIFPIAARRYLKTMRIGGFGHLMHKPILFTIRVNNEEHKVYIPNGEQNCFEACVIWGYEEMRGGDYYVELNQEHEFENELPGRQRHREQAERYIEDIKKQRCETRKITYKKYCKEFKLGYTNQEMNTVMRMLEKKYYVAICSISFTDGYISSVGSIEKERITVIKMKSNGEIHDISKIRKDEMTSGLLHAISVYPGIPISKYDDKEYIKEFYEEIEKVTKEKMSSIFSQCKYDPTVSEVKIKDMVDYQEKRYEKDLTSTLIFTEKSKTKQYEVKTDMPNCYVFSYDLETVTNIKECQSRVYEPFRRECEGDYNPMECVIPFSAQWVPVNVSDMGRYLLRKEMFGKHIRKDFVSQMSEEVFEENVPFEVEDILLDKVVTEYGDFWLGKCVDDMFLHIAEWLRNRKAKIGYLYAHNGVGFDSYVCLQYTRFKVHSNLLKTSRGILTMSLEIILEDGYKVILILRDTKVHVQGSLHSLCKCFNVPKQWVKKEYPIELLTWDTCYDPEILAASEGYGENDVKSLAYIIKRINESIMECDWDPARLSDRPPITQFLTVMSMVKVATYNHFIKIHRAIPCKAVDIPYLRKYLIEATNGGRVNAYCRTYCHKKFKDMMEAFLRDDKETLKEIHSILLEEKSAMQVLDVTSLYPSAQSQCPMPTGKIYYLDKVSCVESIKCIQCRDCEEQFTLCGRHSGAQCELRPFAIIIVDQCKPCKRFPYNCTSGRKKYTNTGKSEGLLYSLETVEEVNQRYGSTKLRDIQAYSNIDLYWMRREGYTYNIIGGFGWEVGMEYHSFIEPAFQKRIEAKKAGNKVLSNSYKLMYNSTYGVTAQQDIDENGFLENFPEDLKRLHHSDDRLLSFLNKDTTKLGCDEYIYNTMHLRNGQTYVKKKKIENIAEFFCDQSPMQIGCAVLAWSRHIMNLVMHSFPILVTQTYTDTDSDCISDLVIQNYLPHLIRNTDDAPLCSFKNDHLEGPNGEPNGKNPRVVLSLIGTKKVKMHVTLNENGEMKVYNTYKGLNPSHVKNGEKMNSEYVEHQIATMLTEINQFGKASPATVTKWSRSLTNGISIKDNQQNCFSKTYLGHSAGSIMRYDVFGNLYEHFVPHGVSDFISNCSTDFVFEKVGKEEYVLSGVGGYNNEELYRKRREESLEIFFKHGEIHMFLAHYYKNKDKVYVSDCQEYNEAVNTIKRVKEYSMFLQ